MFSSVFDAIYWIAVASCALAQVAIVRSVLRMRGAEGESAFASLPRTRPAIEITWVVVPAIALAVVLGVTWRTIHPLTPTAGHMHAAPLPAEPGPSPAPARSGD